MKRLGHPSLKKLQQWLDGEPVRIDKHLAGCTYCADRLEPLLGETDDSIGAALLQLLAVPIELPDRLRSNIDERLANRRELTLISEFFGLPLQTARALTSNDQGDE